MPKSGRVINRFIGAATSVCSLGETDAVGSDLMCRMSTRRNSHPRYRLGSLGYQCFSAHITADLLLDRSLLHAFAVAFND